MDTRGNNGPLIAAGGGALLFISLLLSWNGEVSPWEVYDILDIILALIGIAALVIGGSIAMGNPVNLPGTPGNTVFTAGVFAFAIAAAAVLEGEDLKIGVFLALIGTIAMIVGALQMGRGGDVTATREAPTRVAEPPATSAPPPPPPPSTGV